MPLASPLDSRSPVAPLVMLGAILGFTAPAASQDSLADKAQAARAEAGEYLKKHPVKQSSLFESAFIIVGTLGQVTTMSVDACDLEPFDRGWDETLGPLRENSKTLLSMAFLDGETKQADSLPADQAVIDRSLCAELKREYTYSLRQLKKVVPLLRRAGY